MNPMVDAYLKRLDIAVEALGETVAQQNKALEHHKRAHENALRQYWSKGKDAAILRAEQENEHSHLQAATQYRETLQAMRPHLLQLLQQTKTLREQLIP